MTRHMKHALIALAVVITAGFAMQESSAGYNSSYRQYYGGWSYKPARTYYVRSYYYKPTPTYVGYRYHYCVYYPTRPRYVYYYNPYKRTYWGRFDLEGKEGEHYSLLKPEDRKENLDEIPESSFPKPSKMPEIPEAEDNVRIEPMPKDLPDDKDLPKDE